MSIPPRTQKGESVRAYVNHALSSVPNLRIVAKDNKLIEQVHLWQRQDGVPESKPETITRLARLERRKHEDLRGYDWLTNQRKAKTTVRKQFREDTFGRANGDQNLSVYMV